MEAVQPHAELLALLDRGQIVHQRQLGAGGGDLPEARIHQGLLLGAIGAQRIGRTGKPVIGEDQAAIGADLGIDFLHRGAELAEGRRRLGDQLCDLGLDGMAAQGRAEGDAPIP